MTRAPPIRLLTAVPICDGHDSAITTINMELVRSGVEVIYLGYNRSVRDIVRAAIQEDVRAVGISSYNGGHVEFFIAVVRGLRDEGASDIAVFGGGGATITPADAAIMHRRGVDRIFFAGTPLDEMVEYVHSAYGRRANGLAKHGGPFSDDLALSRQLRRAVAVRPLVPSERESVFGRTRGLTSPARPLVLGLCGPGGAGKTTLIDELVLRYLACEPALRIAILSHDPTLPGGGALLGDRASMIHSQNDRVFMRSIATRGQAGGLSPSTAASLQVLRDAGRFDVILIETVGTGQEAMPFAPGLVDRAILVLSPDYGGRLQLQKIAMIDVADFIVINKSDLSQAQTACAELSRRIESTAGGQRLIATTAKQHRNPGVDQLFAALSPEPAEVPA